MQNLSFATAKDSKFANAEAIERSKNYPEKVVQFGEGNFLRCFVDYMIDIANEKGLFGGRVVLVQPIAQGMCEMINGQDGLYHTLLRGVENGKKVEEARLVSSVSRCVNPYADFETYIKLADNPELRFIVSNTTEAGIAYVEGQSLDEKPCTSYPAKLTQFLYRRYQTFGGDKSRGVCILPVELIERNGDNLKRCVMRHCDDWGLADFKAWLESCCEFTNTLVDRIVTGYPRDEVDALCENAGVRDNLFVTGEFFALWVIEGNKKYADELPLHKAGLDVIWTDNMKPYRDRKVRILNGAHTMTVLAAHSAGLDTVLQCIEAPEILAYMKKGIFEEIIPTLDLPRDELEAFAGAVLERFANEYLRHNLISIALNSTSKYKSRVLPSIVEYFSRTGELPKLLTFSFAALLNFYRGEFKDGQYIGTRIKNGEKDEYVIADDAFAIEIIDKAWKSGSIMKAISAEKIWGMDLSGLPGFADMVIDYLNEIDKRGMKEVLYSIASK